MFGREARLPKDVCFGVSPDNYSNIDHSKNVTGLRQNLQEAYELATREVQKHAAAKKKGGMMSGLKALNCNQEIEYLCGW